MLIRAQMRCIWVSIFVFASLAIFCRRTDASENAGFITSSWTKVCLNGKETRDNEACLTGADSLTKTGTLVVAAVLVEKGGDTSIFRIIVPFGMQLRYGVRVIIDAGSPLVGHYVSCSAKGCAANFNANADLIHAMQLGKDLTVQIVNMQGALISIQLPLKTFAKAYAAPPIDARTVEIERERLEEKLKRRDAVASPIRENISFLADPTVALARSPFQFTDDQIKILTYSPWTKACEKTQATNNKNLCVVSKYGKMENGVPVAIVQLFEPDGQPKVLRVTVALGMQLLRGTRVIFDQETPIQKPYKICFPVGCMSDYPMNDSMVSRMKSGRMITVQAINAQGTQINLPVPLNDFAAVYEGAASDRKELDEPNKKARRN